MSNPTIRRMETKHRGSIGQQSFGKKPKCKKPLKAQLTREECQEGRCSGHQSHFPSVENTRKFASLTINEIKLDIIKTGLFIWIMAQCRM